MLEKLKKIRMNKKEENPLEKLTVDDILTHRPDLNQALRQMWLKSFHVEDLEFVEPESDWKQYIPAVSAIISLIVLIKVW